MQGLLVTGLAGIITIGGSLVALRTQQYRGPVYAVCAGALIGTALLAVVPEALKLTALGGRTPEELLLASAIGFFVFYVLENLPHRGRAHAEVLHYTHGHPTGIWAAAGLAVHSFIDGIAIGEAFDEHFGLGWAVASGVILHKFADGLSVAGVMRGTRQSDRSTWGMVILVAAAPVAGVLTEPFLHVPPGLRALLLGWFAGVFLYLGATSLLPAAHEASSSRSLPLYAIAGATLIFLAQRLIGSHA